MHYIKVTNFRFIYSYDDKICDITKMRRGNINNNSMWKFQRQQFIFVLILC